MRGFVVCFLQLLDDGGYFRRGLGFQADLLGDAVGWVRGTYSRWRRCRA